MATSDGGSTEYYQLPEGAKEIYDLIEYRRMNFSVGNIFKACYRLGQKDGVSDEYDLRKIIFCAQRELARIGKGKPEQQEPSNDTGVGTVRPACYLGAGSGGDEYHDCYYGFRTEPDGIQVMCNCITGELCQCYKAV